MALIDFYIRNQRLSKNGPKIVSDSVNYVDFSFCFKTDDWIGMDKWVVVKKGSEVYRANLINDSVPKETGLNLGEGIWHVSLFGENSEGSRITTNSVSIEIEKSSVPEGGALPVIELSEAEQISAKSRLALDTANEALEKSESAFEKAAAVEEMAANGEFDGKDGEKGDPGITPEIQIGAVETLELDEKASVSVGGSIEKPVLNFAIPRGIRGTGIEEVKVDQNFEDGGYTGVEFALTDGRTYGYYVANGSKGKDGANGLPGLVWSGEWDPETSYSAIRNNQISRDVVYYNGSAYVVAVNSTVPVIGIVPEGDTTGSWAVLAKKGADSIATEELNDRLLSAEGEIENLKSSIAYEKISIVNFAHNSGTKEKGDAAGGVVLSYSFNKVPVVVTINGENIAPAKEVTFEISGDITETTVWKLIAADEKGITAEKSIAINFYDGIYYGTSAEQETVDSAFILGLEKQLSGGKNLTVNITGGEGLYFYYAYPAEMGTSKFNIGGFDYEFEKQTVSFTNMYGLTKDYFVYRSGQPFAEDVSVTVKGG